MDNKIFDYLIIGGGAAGCIVARNLADRLPNAQIAILEAGRSDENDPAANFLSHLDDQDDTYDWGYQANATQNSQRAMAYSRARILGGCANHNDCAFIPPPAADLDRWETLGAKGWNSQTLDPALQRVEQRLHIEASPAGNALSRAFIDANIELGLHERNFRQSLSAGTGWFPLNTLGDLRQSSSVAYLHPIKDLPKNLHVFTGVMTHRLLTENQHIKGVATNRGDFNSRVETILCAGSINTPQLLMLSGIGPAEHLQILGIPVVKNLSGVGQNLMDHVAATISCELKDPSPEWALTPCEATALINVEKPVDIEAELPDVLFHFVLRLREKYVGDTQFQGVEHGVKLSPNVARPKSRGSLLLNSADPLDKPQIDLNYFSDAEGYDRHILLGGLRYARRLTKAGALSPYLKQEITPGCDVESDDELFAYMTQSCETVYHPCGTCAMGNENDLEAVVSPNLKVRGVQGLRIADASVFPDMITVNICNTVMMVAERAVDLICEDAIPYK
jgi:choline dehydrogenase-like flavoprotein